ncbi:MAG: DUF6088 family protein [Bdellovibrionota bacterium]
MAIVELVRKRIGNIPAGEPFTPKAFAGLGTRAAVDQTLSRLARSGAIERVARGVYVRPEKTRFGPVPPSPSKVVGALARATQASVQVHGAEAANKLGLSTQVPARPVFWTSGPSRRFTMGKLEIELRHTSPRKLALAGRPAGLALAALWYLGREEVTPEVVGRIRQKLPEKEFRALQGAVSSMPAWMADAVYRQEHPEHEKGAARG